MASTDIRYPLSTLGIPSYIRRIPHTKVPPDKLTEVRARHEAFAPPDKGRTREEGLQVARAIVTHDGYLNHRYLRVVATLKDKDVLPQYGTTMDFDCPAAIDRYMMPPLIQRPFTYQLEFWSKRINNDFFATVFRLFSGVVDIKSLCEDTWYADSWVRGLELTMVLMHHLIISAESGAAVINSDDKFIKKVCIFKLPDKKKDLNDKLKDFSTDCKTEHTVGGRCPSCRSEAIGRREPSSRRPRR